MDLPIWVTLLAAVLIVFATSAFKHVEWSHRVKSLVATVASILAAAVATVAAGDFNAENLWESSLAMFGLSQAFYHLFFKGTSPDAKLTAMGDNMTTPEQVY